MSQLNPVPGDRSPVEQRGKRAWLNIALFGVVAQSGCLTLVIVLVALLGGLWLDAHFQTRPMLTILLVLLSIPVSLITMFIVVRFATAKIKANLENSQE